MSAYNSPIMTSLAVATTISLCMLAAAVALLLLTALLRKLRVQWALEKDFPVPPGAHWLLGHMVLLRTSDREIKNMLTGWAIQYKGAYIFKFHAARSQLRLGHPEYVKAVLLRSDKKDEIIYDVLRPWLGNGLLTSSGAKWFRNRRLLTSGFHFEILRPYVKLFADSTNVMLDNLENLPPGSSIDVFHHVSLMTLYSMLKCALSQDTGCQTRNTFNGYISAVHELTELAIKRLRNLMYIMSDSVYNFSSDGKRYKKACNLVHQFSEAVIQQRKKDLNGLSETAQQRKYLDFLDILLKAKDEDGNGLTDAEIRDEVDTFMFEGHDTTASGLSWTLYCLARYPEHQEKCRKEAQEVLQGKTAVTWDDLPSMKYITMCIKESLRMYPPVPYTFRELEQPLTFSDGRIAPKGSNIFIMVQHLHHNPNIWEKPQEYDPLRFSPEKSKNRHPYAFLPFSAGPRNCIGQHFAMNELKTAVALILQRFSLTPDDTLPEPFPITRMVLRADSPGLFLKIKPTRTD